MTVEGALVPDVAAWQAQMLRLTAFPVDAAAAFDVDWWQQLIGEVPQETTTKKSLQRTAEGPYEEHYLQLTVDGLRIQWGLFPKIDTSTIPSGLPTMGPFSSVLDIFSQLMQRWIDQCPPIERLAFGGVLLQLMDTHQSAYEILDRYLPSVTVDPSTRDLNYRINRPRPSSSGIEGLEVNRLSTWAALQWTIARLQPGIGPPKQFPSGQGYASRLELDINSAQDFAMELPRAALKSLWTELVDLRREIATKGDAP